MYALPSDACWRVFPTSASQIFLHIRFLSRSQRSSMVPVCLNRQHRAPAFYVVLRKESELRDDPEFRESMASAIIRLCRWRGNHGRTDKQRNFNSLFEALDRRARGADHRG